MSAKVIHDRGRGPEIAGTRITVYNLLQSFLDPKVTEEEICRVYELTPEQVAAARAYVLSNPKRFWPSISRSKKEWRRGIHRRSGKRPSERRARSKNSQNR